MKDTINIGDTKEMLCEMLAIPSVSGDEGALSDYIAQKLRDAGAECVRQQIVDGDRRNVFAEVQGKRYCLQGTWIPWKPEMAGL